VQVQIGVFDSRRKFQYESISVGQQAAQRQPTTVVSMALRFHESMLEVAAEQHVDVNTASVGKKDDLLTTVIGEYNEFGVVATNEKYKLNSHQRISISNLLLHCSTKTLKGIQGVYNTMRQSATPFDVNNLQTSRWLIGGRPARRSSKTSMWESLEVMTPEKQELFIEILGFICRRSAKTGKSAKMDTAEWSTTADYACWAGHGFALLKAKENGPAEEDIVALRQRIIDKDFWDKFQALNAVHDEEFTENDFPFWPKHKHDEDR